MTVVFVLDVPSGRLDSFFSGNVFVTSKENIFEPSFPFRHGAELLRIQENHLYSQKELREKALLLYTDGCPDHRLT